MKENPGLRHRVREALAPLNKLDKTITEQLTVCAQKSSTCGQWRSHMKALEISCHGIPWLGGCLIVLWWSKSHYTQEVLVNLLLALVLDLTIVAVLKAIVRRGRPETNSMDMFAVFGVDNYSFPSGHTSRATMIASLFYTKNILGWFVCLVVGLWAIAVGLSRVFLGRHHVGDVLVGVLLGLLESWLVDWWWLDSDASQDVIKMFFQFESFHSGDMT